MDEQRNHEELFHMLSNARRPSYLLKPHIGKCGNQWSVLYGDNVATGVCGFGDTPEKAMADFDNNWYCEKITTGYKGE